MSNNALLWECWITGSLYTLTLALLLWQCLEQMIKVNRKQTQGMDLSCKSPLLYFKAGKALFIFPSSVTYLMVRLTKKFIVYQQTNNLIVQRQSFWPVYIRLWAVDTIKDRNFRTLYFLQKKASACKRFRLSSWPFLGFTSTDAKHKSWKAKSFPSRINSANIHCFQTNSWLYYVVKTYACAHTKHTLSQFSVGGKNTFPLPKELTDLSGNIIKYETFLTKERKRVRCLTDVRGVF